MKSSRGLFPRGATDQQAAKAFDVLVCAGIAEGLVQVGEFGADDSHDVGHLLTPRMQLSVQCLRLARLIRDITNGAFSQLFLLSEEVQCIAAPEWGQSEAGFPSRS